MKVAAHVVGFNVNRFIKSALQNMEPHVDKIYITHAEFLFAPAGRSGETWKNHTTMEDLHAASDSNKVEIVTGEWANEEDMRNACLSKARADGFDWFLIQDADEFYPAQSWEHIKKFLHQNKADNHLAATSFNFWKSSHYVMLGRNGSIKSTNAGFGIRCSADIKFVYRRICNNQRNKIIDEPCHHYSYVMSDTEMAEKLAYWRHTHQLYSNNWFTYKWLNWNESTCWLNPLNPMECLRAISFPMQQPDFAEEFALPVNLYEKKSIPKFGHIIGEAVYDASVRLTIGKLAIKRVVKSVLPGKRTQVI